MRWYLPRLLSTIKTGKGVAVSWSGNGLLVQSFRLEIRPLARYVQSKYTEPSNEFNTQYTAYHWLKPCTRGSHTSRLCPPSRHSPHAGADPRVGPIQHNYRGGLPAGVLLARTEILGADERITAAILSWALIPR
jgi:hypothetical protein